jgi:Fe2+ or Zn2+ uptake regulation protein
MDTSLIWERLRNCGLRITPLKKQVVELFMNGACGLSASEIRNRLSCDPHISTVHRCVSSLVKVGFLRFDLNSEGILRYRCSRSFYPDHGHFRCHTCGKRFPVEFSIPEEFIDSVEKTFSFTIINSDFYLEGKCSICSKKS